MSNPTTLQANLVPFAISPDGVTYKNVVCLKAWNFNGSTSTTKEETQCGPFVGLGSNSWSFDFEFVLNSTPNGSTEATFANIIGYWDAQTNIYVKVQYPTSGGSAGGTIYLQGQGYITSFKINGQVGSLITVQGTFENSGAIDVTA